MNLHTRPLRHINIWLMWGIAVTFVLFKLFLQFSSGVLFNELVESFSLSATQSGLLASSYYFIYVFMQIPAGILVDRFGVRRLLTASTLVCAGGCYLFATSQTLLAAEIGRLLIGAGASFGYICQLDIILKWFPKRRYAWMIGLSEGIGMFGSIIANIFLAEMLAQFHWRKCMLAATFIAFVISLLAFTILRDKSGPNATSNSLENYFTLLLTVFKNKLLWLNGIHLSMMFSIISVFAALWSVPFLMAAIHCDLPTATILSTGILAGVTIGSPFMGALFPKINNAYLFQGLCSMVCCLLFVAITYFKPQTAILMAILLFLLGLACSSYVNNFTLATEHAPQEAQAVVIGFTNTWGVGSAPLLQPFIGFLLDWQHHGSPIQGQYALLDYNFALSIMPIGLCAVSILAVWLGVVRLR